jgi:hypothetical protein
VGLALFGVMFFDEAFFGVVFRGRAFFCGHNLM